jgi:hypothetical protein
MEQRQKNTLSRASKFVLKVIVEACATVIIQKIIGLASSP